MRHASRDRRSHSLDSFLSTSQYTAPVDLKKLGFIYRAIEEYASKRGINTRDLRILEVACGEGGITLPLVTLGSEITAFDIDERAVRHLRERIPVEAARRVTVTEGNGYAFDDGRMYDIVIASEIFEHVLDPARLANNVRKRMHDGSRLILTTPNGYGPWEIKNRLDPRMSMRKWNWLRRHFGKPPYERGSGGEHCQFYTKKRLLELLSSVSLQLVSFGKSDSVLVIFGPFRNSRTVGSLDTRLADVLPYWLASGWYFVFDACPAMTPSLSAAP